MNVLVRVRALARLAILFLPICADTQALAVEPSRQLTNEEVVNLYISIAFGSEFGFLTEAVADKIWKRDPKQVVNIIPFPSESVPIDETLSVVSSVVAEIASHSDEVDLRTLGPSDVAELQSGGEAAWRAILADSVIVHVGSRAELQSSLEAYGAKDPAIAKMYAGTFAPPLNEDYPLCLAASNERSQGSMLIGTSIAWVQSGPALRECLYEEIMQSFGIANDLPAGTPSIFNDDQRYQQPTGLDWVLWKLHNDPRIVAGMSITDVRAVAPTILSDLER